MKSFSGVYAAISTPFDENGKPALDQFQAHLRLLANRGCHGVLAAGTTGEGPSLSVDERIDLFAAVAASGANLRLLAGTGAASLEDAITLSRAAFEHGADAIVVIPPFFYLRPTLSGLIDFYSRLIQAAVPEDGGLLLYHNPTVSAPLIEPELIARLRDAFPNQVLGMKDSGGDIRFTETILQEFPGFQVFIGDDRLLSESLGLGAAGCITALAGIFSNLAREVFDLYHAGQSTEDAQARLTHAHAQIADLPRIAAIKYLLKRGGILHNDEVRPPVSSLNETHIDLLRERFRLHVTSPQSIDLSELGNSA